MDPTSSTALEAVRQWAESVDWRSTRLVLLVGFSEPSAWSILRRSRGDLIVVVYEPDPDLAAAAEATRPDKRVVVVSDPVALRTALTVHARIGWHVETLGEERLEAHGPAVKAALDDALRFVRVNETTARVNAAKWADIGIAELPHLVDRPHLASMPRCLAGIPGVVVGAGPSLDRNIETLKRLADRVAVIAVNSAIGPLERAGIIPDLVCALETQGLSLAPVMRSRSMAESVLVPGIHVWPGIWAAPTKHVLPAIQAVGPVGSWLTRLGVRQITNGGSVSTLAYRVAENLGCDPIILVGCDCARGGDDGTTVYATGTAHGAHRRVADQSGFLAVPAWGGSGMVPATAGLCTYREWFEGVARQPGPRRINATEGGARIEGWEEMPLSDCPIPRDPTRAFLRVTEAMETAPLLDRRLVLRALEAQLSAGREAAERAGAIARRFEDAAVELRETIAWFEAAEILAAAGTPQVDDVGDIVSYESLATSARVQRRVAVLWPAVEAAIEQAIEEIRRG